MSCCCDELSKRSSTDFDISAINTVFNLPPGLHKMPVVVAAMGKATEALLQRLGDAEAVCGSWYDDTSDLEVQLLQLSHSSVLALLRSDNLKARSENSVLMMADAWVVNSPAGKSCNPAQLRQVAEAVRMGQLSLNFFHVVVPQLSWIEIRAEERESLLLYVSLARSLLARQFSGPRGWFNASQRPLGNAAPLVMKWATTKDHLASHLSSGDLQLWSDRRHFFGGFSLRLCVGHQDGKWYLGFSACVFHVGCSNSLQCVSSSTVSMKVSERAAAGSWSAASQWSGFLKSSEHSFVLLLKDLPQGASSFDIAQWEPYLVNGRLQVEASLGKCE